jgi:HAD superfamily hydrolase (TIGR01509 family)
MTTTGGKGPWRAFLFDLDGTLVDSSTLHERAFQEVLAAEAPEVAAVFEYRSIMGMETRAALVRLGVQTPAALTRISGMKRERYRELAQLGFLQEMPGARALLEHLRARGARVGVVTSASTASADLALTVAGLRTAVDFVVAAEDAAHSKPDPAPYLRGLERCGAGAGEVVAIEDAAAGVQAARAAGLTVLGVHDRGVAMLADAYFESLDRLREHLAEPTGCLAS